METISVAVLVVTYNRLEKLKKSLKAYNEQIYCPRCIVVVNNASTDGTKEYLDIWKSADSNYEKVVINLPNNVGGSGGFFAGEEYFMKRDDLSWLLIADDDAYPEPLYIQGLVSFLQCNNASDYSVVCGKVIEHNSVINGHRERLKSKWVRGFKQPYAENIYTKDVFEPDFVSYVGILVNKEKMKKVGIVNKDYFIWYDDTEHSYRLKSVGKMVCLPQYTIIHDIDKTNESLSWKSYYGFRNNVDFFKKNFPLQMPFVVFCSFVKSCLCPLRGKSFVEMKLRLTAILDGLIGNLGKHQIYKPGWKPDK